MYSCRYYKFKLSFSFFSLGVLFFFLLWIGETIMSSYPYVTSPHTVIWIIISAQCFCRISKSIVLYGLIIFAVMLVFKGESVCLYLHFLQIIQFLLGKSIEDILTEAALEKKTRSELLKSTKDGKVDATKNTTSVG